MFTILLLQACGGDPMVTVRPGAHPDAPSPAALAGALERQIQRPIQRCYEVALGADSGLAGRVAIQVYGSHGILKAQVTEVGPAPLVDCALEPMSDMRLMRALGDGDQAVGFTLTVDFAS